MNRCLPVLLSLALAGAVQAQVPAGKELRANLRTERVQLDPAVSYAPDGSFAVIWSSQLPNRPGDQYTRAGIAGRIFSADGTSGREFIVRQSDGTIPGLPTSAWQAHRLLVVWGELGPANVYARLLDDQGRALGPALRAEPESSELQGLATVIPVANGGFVAAWITATITPDLPISNGFRLRRFDSQGKPLGAAVEIDRAEDSVPIPSLAYDRQGRILAVWSFLGKDAEGGGISGQLLTGSLEPIGERFLVNTTEKDDQFTGRAAALPDGFVVVWQSAGQDGSLEGIYGQLIGADGQKIGPEFQVNTVTVSAQRAPDVAADSHGNFIVVWQSFDVRTGFWNVRGRFYRAGIPVGDEFEINDDPVRSGDIYPRVAFGPDGTFAVAWQVFDDSDDISARRFAASPGDEPCIVTPKGLLCDTGRTGGTAELFIPLKVSGSENILIGDVDGDGRQDLCLNRGTAYRCDTDRDGFAETTFRFGSGRSGEVGLLGDVDGDGQAEACVREGREVRCDTGHNGGRAEWTLSSFGRPSDRIVLGDVNGDGRDDVCAFRAGRFLCELNGDGTAEVDLAFGEAGDDVPLLGDYDGDGRDDPCVFRDGRFLCDTAHDGGEAEGVLAFGSPGSVPLLANLDGI